MPRSTPCSSVVRALAPAAIVALLLPSTPARATTMERATVEELARASDAVVRGEVTHAVSQRAGTRIFTEVRLRVTSVWRGAAPAEVVVRVPGGVVDGIGQRTDGAPTFTVGEQVAAFLVEDGRGRYRVNGLGQGKFSLRAGRAAPELERLRLVPRELPAGERAAEEMPATELERRVKGAR